MHPSHFISSAQINLISVNEYAQTRNPAGHDIIRPPKGTPSLLIAFFLHHVLGIIITLLCCRHIWKQCGRCGFFFLWKSNLCCTHKTTNDTVVLDKYELSRWVKGGCVGEFACFPSMCFAAKRCAAGVGDAEAGLCLLWEGWAPAGYVQKSVGPSALRRSRRESRLIDWDQHSPLPPSLAPPLQPTPPPSSPPLLHLLLLLLVCSRTGSTFACLHHPSLSSPPTTSSSHPLLSVFTHSDLLYYTHSFLPSRACSTKRGENTVLQ